MRALSAPAHYYALFGLTDGCDVLLTFYERGGDGARDGGGGGGGGGCVFEVEQKYTTFVDLAARRSDAAARPDERGSRARSTRSRRAARPSREDVRIPVRWAEPASAGAGGGGGGSEATRRAYVQRRADLGPPQASEYGWVSDGPTSGQGAGPSEYGWVSDGPTDSGPLLRLEARDRHLTKAERYGHP